MSTNAVQGLADDQEIPSEAETEDQNELSKDDLRDLVMYTLDWSVESLLSRIGKSFDINPEFQRRDAWTADRKSRYIESLILGLPVPQIVLAEDKNRKGRFIVLDGKQRLITLMQFAGNHENFRPFALKKLEFAKNVEGMTFDDMKNSVIHDDDVENFLSQPIRTIVLRDWNKPVVLYQVFIRLNLGSLPLSPQELRQALYPGEFTTWINKRSAESAEIQRARRRSGADFRMRDAEMLLRAVAFMESLESYTGNMREFLDDACVAGQVLVEKDGLAYFNSIADRIEDAIQRVFRVFGDDFYFFRFADGSFIRRFNVSVFDVLVLVLSDDGIAEDDLDNNASEIKQAYVNLSSDDTDFQSYLISTTKTPQAVAGRILKYAKSVESVLGRRLGITHRAQELLERHSR